MAIYSTTTELLKCFTAIFLIITTIVPSWFNYTHIAECGLKPASEVNGASWGHLHNSSPRWDSTWIFPSSKGNFADYPMSPLIWHKKVGLLHPASPCILTISWGRLNWEIQINPRSLHLMIESNLKSSIITTTPKIIAIRNCKRIYLMIIGNW